jgi:hypothetical protein
LLLLYGISFAICIFYTVKEYSPIPYLYPDSITMRFYVLYSLNSFETGAGFKHVATVEVPKPPKIDGMEYALERLFRAMNVVDGAHFEVPQKIKNRSMSVGDVAMTSDGFAFLCAPNGWEAMSPEQVLGLVQFLSEETAPKF